MKGVAQFQPNTSRPCHLIVIFIPSHIFVCMKCFPNIPPTPTHWCRCPFILLRWLKHKKWSKSYSCIMDICIIHTRIYQGQGSCIMHHVSCIVHHAPCIMHHVSCMHPGGQKIHASYVSASCMHPGYLSLFIKVLSNQPFSCRYVKHSWVFTTYVSAINSSTCK